MKERSRSAVDEGKRSGRGSRVEHGGKEMEDEQHMSVVEAARLVTLDTGVGEGVKVKFPVVALILDTTRSKGSSMLNRGKEERVSGTRLVSSSLSSVQRDLQRVQLRSDVIQRRQRSVQLPQLVLDHRRNRHVLQTRQSRDVERRDVERNIHDLGNEVDG